MKGFPMLNETLEYKQYVTKSEILYVSGKNEEKLYSIFKMIPRALTIIARHELEEKKYWDTKDLKKRKEIRNDVTKTLSSWCFDETSEKFDVTLIQQIDYDEKLIPAIQKKNSPDSWASGNIYSPLGYTYPNIYALNFPRVIRTAITLGPLKGMRLSCNKKLFEDLYKDTESEDADLNISLESKEKDPETGKVIWKKLKRQKEKGEQAFICETGENKGNLSQRAKEPVCRLFKLIAAYLLACNQDETKSDKTEENLYDSTYLNLPLIGKWLDYAEPFRTKYYYKGELIFNRDKNNNKLWTMNTNFRKEYDLKIEEFDYSHFYDSNNNQPPAITGDRCYIYDLKDELLFPSPHYFINTN